MWNRVFDLIATVIQPTPAIVSQGAVHRLSRLALVLLCAAYVMPGFFRQHPWKSADMTAFGYMLELAGGRADWLAPRLAGLAPEVDGLLPYWLGAWAVQLGAPWVPPEIAARIPYVGLLAAALFATWWGTYFLARNASAQPVAFAFGGEALPSDYARAIADGGLLAFMATLGLAQLSHETTPAQAQLCFTALALYALAALPFRTVLPALAGLTSLAGLSLSGAPSVAFMLGFGGALIHGMDKAAHALAPRRHVAATWGIVLASLLGIGIATLTSAWHWRIEAPEFSWDYWQSRGRLLLWFTWPAWPLMLWTLWRWRLQLTPRQVHRHLALPLWFVFVTLGTTLTTEAADRALLLSLPAMAMLAAFALPTLGRSVGALIDWFTLLFFTGCGVVIWTIWIAMQTGVPAAPAANIERLFPGFKPSFGGLAFAIALVATVAWGWLVKWRVGRHQSAIWKSVVLPAGGAVTCWLLLLTLWLPLFDFARSYEPMIRQAQAVFGTPECVMTRDLSRGEIAAVQFHARTRVEILSASSNCRWLLVDKDSVSQLGDALVLSNWTQRGRAAHPSDKNAGFVIFQRN